MLDAVIFDFDGVLADTERLHLAGFRHALSAHGIEISEADYFARYLGSDDREGFAAMLRDNGVGAREDAVRDLMISKEKRFRELVADRVRIFPGVPDLLGALRAEPRIPTAVGSGALHAEIALVLEVAELRSFFDVIVSADDVARSKPDPETFTTAMDRLGALGARVSPDRCVVIEDSRAGLRAARAAGALTVAVAHSHDRDALDADLVVDSIGELTRRRLEALAAGDAAARTGG